MASETEQNPNDIIIPDGFQEIPVPVPPMLFAMANCTSTARFVAWNYLGTNPTWDDGRASATFNYFVVFQPYVDHPAIRFYVRDKDIGTDDSFPTHSIVFDTVNDKTYLAEYKAAQSLLNAQHPPLQPVTITQEELKEIARQMGEKFKNLGDMQFHGMFGFLQAENVRDQETQALTEWLNKHTPDEVRETFSRLGFKF